MTATTLAPARTRFRPTRAGIVNLWDYRDDEFVFAGGKLVLRGPNGSGKTKALEVLFPFVFDGRIEPRRGARQLGEVERLDQLIEARMRRDRIRSADHRRIACH